MAILLETSVNPYAITDLERVSPRLLAAGRQRALEMARCGSGYGAIEQSLRRRGIGSRAAQEIAETAIADHGLRLKALGFGRSVLGAGLLCIAWCLLQIVWPRIAIALAMFGMFLLMTGCSLAFHSVPQRRFGRAMERQS